MKRKQCRRCKCWHAALQRKCLHWPLRFGPDWKVVRAELAELEEVPG